MWLKNELTSNAAISAYRAALLRSRPRHVVIDNLFDETKLDGVLALLEEPQQWQQQQHTYSALYVDSNLWQNTNDAQRFVQRDIWQRKAHNPSNNIAHAFLSFLRGDIFMSFLSRIFNIEITDINVADPIINTNYFRLSPADFVRQHADDSPGRQVCMLLYLNKAWQPNSGGELVFKGQNNKPIHIAPHYNRCVLFDPSSKGSEHWVETVNNGRTQQYRYNVTSWYWSE